ncbi:hypothetical protein [Vibrio quintilis]|uniref:Uncharacterized protein n=1 Tax=Vibrio quintilis TaxID=1117707 RepID=A0A1M7Z337_9VIBR|nr:hypothetical protein [Vibrio quintilis]SHO59244.1 hypothetical protein VQ7734_05024 [Vibrio quintilis]
MDMVITRTNSSEEWYPFDESLHVGIFHQSIEWKSMKNLKKIRDFYKTNSSFRGDELIALINEMNIICPKLSKGQAELKEVIKLLQEDTVVIARFAGD